jgi:hypothetical protein
VGSIYGASIGARRSIHASGGSPAAHLHAVPAAAPVTRRLLPVTAAVAAILGPGTHATFSSARH